MTLTRANKGLYNSQLIRTVSVSFVIVWSSLRQAPNLKQILKSDLRFDFLLYSYFGFLQDMLTIDLRQEVRR